MSQVIVPNDIVEQILVKLDVKHLISCKTVCKQWHSLISKSRFVKSHLQKSVTSHRRIDNTAWTFYDTSNRYEVNNDTHIVGSSNGLVCMSCNNDKKFFVFNPSTREVKKVKDPDIRELKIELYDMDEVEVDWKILCMGFGYDSTIDDYKIVLGFVAFHSNTCFIVMNLKSGEWRVVDEIGYLYTSRENRFGTLCDGSLYWFMKNDYSKEVSLIEFDLSKEEFSELPQPESLGYTFTKDIRLGIMNGCFCIFHSSRPKFKKWVVKTNEIGLYWELLDDDVEFSNCLPTECRCRSCVGNKCSIDDPNIWLSTTWQDTGERTNFDVWFLTNSEDISAPIYVESLVSPHGNDKKKRKRLEIYSNGSSKTARF